MSFADKVIEYEFNNLCNNHHVRCLRNNIYQSIHVQNFSHLFDLWTNHKHGPCGDYALLIRSLRYILIKDKNFLNNRLLNTYGYMFNITVDVSEEGLIKMVKEMCSKSKK